MLQKFPDFVKMGHQRLCLGICTKVEIDILMGLIIGMQTSLFLIDYALLLYVLLYIFNYNNVSGNVCNMNQASALFPLSCLQTLHRYLKGITCHRATLDIIWHNQLFMKVYNMSIYFKCSISSQSNAGANLSNRVRFHQVKWKSTTFNMSSLCNVSHVNIINIAHLKVLKGVLFDKVASLVTSVSANKCCSGSSSLISLVPSIFHQKVINALIK